MKKSLFSILLAILIVMSNVVSVSAITFTDAYDALDLFPEDSVSCEGNKITLLRSIDTVAEGIENDGEYLDFNTPLVFTDGTYVIDFNGFSLFTNMIDNAPALIIEGNANVTFQTADNTYSDFYGSVEVQEGGVLTVDAVNISGDLNNAGTVTITDSSVYGGFVSSEGTITLNNFYADFKTTILDGKAYINDGDFYGGLSQLGGEMYITDCYASSAMNGLFVSRDAIKTVISGGSFMPYTIEHPEYPYVMDGITFDVGAPADTVFEEDYIYNFIPDGYKAVYDGFTAQDVGIGEDGLLDWYIGYSSLEIYPSSENYSDIMKRITTSDTWTICADAPKDEGESEFLFTAIANSLVNDSTYSVEAYSGHAPFDPSKAYIYIYDYETGTQENYLVDVEYTALDTETKNAVSGMLERMKAEENDTKFYTLSDLYLFNYITTLKKYCEDINEIDYIYEADHTAINFTKEFIEDVGDGKFSFGIDVRLGSDPTYFVSAIGGHAIIMYDGKVCATTQGGVIFKNVLHIPMDTANTPEAYRDAAMKRINDHFGKDSGISISIGGRFSDLDSDILEIDAEDIDFTNAGDSYFTATINDYVIPSLVICKSDDATDFTVPSFNGGDIVSKIKVRTNDASVPLDTQVIVNKVENDDIKKALGTDAYMAYDITLYSRSLGKNITKLDNGNFIVSVPVPDFLKDKENLTIFYVPENSKPEEYTVTFDKDGNAVFETDHFSTYAITTKKTVEVKVPTTSPNTGAKGLLASMLSVLFIAVLLPLFTLKKA